MSICYFFRLAEVGRLEQAKSDGKYETGQLFLHRIFGYRGVVLFPWTARVFDRDLHNPNKAKTASSSANSANNNSTTQNSIKGKTTTPFESTAKTNDKGTNKSNGAAASLKSHLNDVVSTLNGNAGLQDTSNLGDNTKSASTEENAAKTNAAETNSTTQAGSSATQDQSNNNKEVKGKVQTFYQVLIDSRDCPYIVSIYI